jgi:hypothetical protein
MLARCIKLKLRLIRADKIKGDSPKKGIMKRIIVIAALLTLGSASVVTATDSSASTSGAACVFLAPNAIISNVVGHVGWGFELPNGTWEFGANDGAPPGSKISQTVKGTGSKATMLNDFATASSGSNAYIEYKCATVSAANASAAQQEVTREWNETYSIPKQDCESQVYNVLNTYGVKNMWRDSDLFDPFPINWFGWLFLVGFPANPASL